MKYSDSVKTLLLAAIDELAANPEKYAKYQLIACDGSSLDIFRNSGDPDTFFETNSKSPRGYNQVYINACYSILDRRFTRRNMSM